MKPFHVALLAVGLVLGAWVAPRAIAAQTDPDVARLSAELNQLVADPDLGQYATGQQTLARNAIAELERAGRSGHDHALFMAEQRVALAKAAARVDADRAKLDQLQREHDQIMLQASQAEAAIARAELAHQKLQYQAAVQQAQLLQEQGAQASQQAQQAQAEAAQAKRLASAQARAATLARKEARLAEAATKALQGGAVASGSDHAGAGSGAASSMLLSPGSFTGKSSDLTASAHRRVAEFARQHAGQRIEIVPRGTSDSRVLAGRRAVSVEAALEAAGAGTVSIGTVGQSSAGAEVELRVH